MDMTYPAFCGVAANDFADALAAMFRLPGATREVFPEVWRDMAALLHTLIEDYRMNTGDVSGLPVQVVSRYRAAVGV